MRWTESKAPLFVAALALLLLLAAAGVSQWTTTRLVGNEDWVIHTRHVLETLAEVRATISQAEAGQRGFLITADPQYLETYTAAAAEVKKQTRRLVALTADNEQQQTRAETLRALVKARLERLQENVAARVQYGFAVAQQRVGTDEGQALMEQIRDQIKGIKAAEAALLGMRAADSARSLRAKVYINVAGTLLSIGAVCLAFFLFVRRLSERRESELRAQAQSRREAAIGELGLAALTDSDIDALLDRAVHLTAQVLEVPLVKVLELLPDGSGLRLRAGVGWAEGLVGTAIVSAELDSQAGYTLKASKPVVAGDLTTHEPVMVDDLRKETRFKGPELLQQHGVVSGISVIIPDQPNRPYGVMGAHTTAHRAFTAAEDAYFLQAMANVLASAIRHREAEGALRESERRFRALADSVPDIVWTSEPDGRCDYVNRRWTDLTGRSADDAYGLKWVEALHEEDRQRSGERWMRSMQSGEPFDCEYRFLSRDGSSRWCLGRALPLRDQRGRIVKWFGNCLDVDEQKRLEQALREADRRKDRFLAVLAHELRNPLASIAYAAQTLAMEDPTAPPVQEAANLIDRQVSHITRLVEELADASRISRGKMSIQKERTDLTTIVNRAVETTRAGIEARSQRLEVQLPAEPLWIEADPTRMAQVLGNLLVNASKYTDDAGRISLRATREGAEVAIRVRDTGVGIPREALDRIFEDFFQVEGSEKRCDGGLGIGLSLVRRLVELHGGSVRAYSDGPGRGAELVIRLPALTAGAPLPKGQPDGAERPAQAQHRVLVVDDHKLMADSLAQVLTRRGCETRVAYSGAEGLRILQGFEPDLVLLDIGLPGMDGYELARRIRGRARCNNAVLVALSGYEPDAERLAQDTIFDDYAVKPVSAWTLEALLARHGRGEHRPQPPASAPPLVN
jgi:PAS domain S-box-containing protein